jgi:hypothetical protein
MNDILEILQTLPPTCAAFIDGKPVLIRRGAREALPTFDDPNVYNTKHGISPEQVERMITGVVLGWEKLAPEPEAMRRYDCLVQAIVPVHLMAGSIEQAKSLACELVNNLVFDFGGSVDHVDILL